MQSALSTALAAAIVLSCAQHAEAQAFSIDFGFRAGVPGIDFDGASTPEAPQAGIWLIPTTNGNYINFVGVFDINFDLTDVTMTSDRPVISSANTTIGGNRDLVGLVADGIEIGGPTFRSGPAIGPLTLTLDGIENGSYEIITYTAPYLDFIASVEVTINGDSQTAGGDFPSLFFVEGVTHTRHQTNITDNLLTMHYETVTGQGVINGFQIIPIPAPASLILLPAWAAITQRRR